MKKYHNRARGGLRIWGLAVVMGMAATLSGHWATHAQDTGFGPAIGASAPHALTLQDHTGAERSFAELIASSEASNGVVVYFNRSLDWCPFCKAQTIEIDAQLSDFTERGYAVVTVTTDAPEKLARFAERREIQSVLLADPDREAIQAFDVVDPVFADKKPGDRAFALPYPSAFVIDADGVVVAKFLEADGYGQRRGYAERITVDGVLAGLDAVAVGG